MTRPEQSPVKGDLFSASGPYGQLGPTRLPDASVRSTLAAGVLSDTGQFEQFSIPRGRLEIEIANFRSLVFDVDGLLVNSEPVILYAILETAKSYLHTKFKTTFSEDHAEAIKLECFGNSEDLMCKKLFDYLNSREMLLSSVASLDQKQFFDRFIADRVELYLNLCKQGYIQPMPGAVEFVRQAYAKFGPMAINTGSPEVMSASMLNSAFGKHFDVEQFFPRNLRTYVSDLAQGWGKPNPDGYLRAANKLKIPPWELIAVVDRGNDCISALRARYGLVLIVPENLDMAPLIAESGKHSLRAMLQGLPEHTREEFDSKVITINSLGCVDLVDAKFDA